MRSRAFLVLCFSVLSASIGINMVTPILPLVARDLGAEGVWLGLAFSAIAISLAISTIPIGRLSDRWGRRPFMIAGFLIYGSCSLGYIFATSFEVILVARFIAGFGAAGTFPIAMAYVGDLAPRDREGTYMGTFNVATFLGFGAGPLLGGVLRDAAGNDAAFVAMGSILFASAVLVFLLLPPRPPQPDGLADAEARGARVPLWVVLRDRMVRALAIFAFTQHLAMGAAFAFLALLMDENYGASAAMIGVAFAARTWSNGFSSPFFGRLADRFDRVRLVTLGLVAAAIPTFVIGDAPSLGVVLILFLAAGLAEGLAWPAQSAILVDRGRTYGMGTLQGISQTFGPAGLLVGSIVAGVIADVSDLATVFRFAGIMLAAGALLFFFLARSAAPLPADPVGEPVEAAGPEGARTV